MSDLHSLVSFVFALCWFSCYLGHIFNLQALYGMMILVVLSCSHLWNSFIDWKYTMIRIFPFTWIGHIVFWRRSSFMYIAFRHKQFLVGDIETFGVAVLLLYALCNFHVLGKQRFEILLLQLSFLPYVSEVLMTPLDYLTVLNSLARFI